MDICDRDNSFLHPDYLKLENLLLHEAAKEELDKESLIDQQKKEDKGRPGTVRCHTPYLGLCSLPNPQLNHNSTQPQPNITLVGLDTKMTLHTTPPPHHPTHPPQGSPQEPQMNIY